MVNDEETPLYMANCVLPWTSIHAAVLALIPESIRTGPGFMPVFFTKEDAAEAFPQHDVELSYIMPPKEIR